MPQQLWSHLPQQRCWGQQHAQIVQLQLEISSVIAGCSVNVQQCGVVCILLGVLPTPATCSLLACSRCDLSVS